MRNKNLAFIDVETTGFDTEKHEIIEIGCVIASQDGDELKIVDEFDIKIKPEKIEHADPEALQINGYNESDWLFAISKEEAIKQLAEKTADCIMVAHNIAFDYAFIAKAFSDTGIENKMFYHKLDTVSFAFAKLHRHDDVSKFSLARLCEHFGIVNERAHTALADARATFELYKRLVEM